MPLFFHQTELGFSPKPPFPLPFLYAEYFSERFFIFVVPFRFSVSACPRSSKTCSQIAAALAPRRHCICHRRRRRRRLCRRRRRDPSHLITPSARERRNVEIARAWRPVDTRTQTIPQVSFYVWSKTVWSTHRRVSTRLAVFNFFLFLTPPLSRHFLRPPTKIKYNLTKRQTLIT